MTQLQFYLDADAQKGSLASALRLRGVDVETANDAGLRNAADPEQLAHAAAQGRVLYTFNIGDFMRLHAAYVAEGREHSGIVFGDQQRYGVGEQTRRLLRLSQMRSAEQLRNSIEFLSAWG